MSKVLKGLSLGLLMVIMFQFSIPKEHWNGMADAQVQKSGMLVLAPLALIILGALVGGGINPLRGLQWGHVLLLIGVNGLLCCLAPTGLEVFRTAAIATGVLIPADGFYLVWRQHLAPIQI